MPQRRTGRSHARSREPHFVELAVRVIDGPGKPAVFGRGHFNGYDGAALARLEFRAEEVPGFGLAEFLGLRDHLVGQELVGGVNDEVLIVRKTYGKQGQWLSQKKENANAGNCSHGKPSLA